MTGSNLLLIFDGDCGFCTSVTNFFLKHSSVPLKAEPWQYIDPADYGLTRQQVAAKVYFLVESNPYAGHEAFAMLLRVQSNALIRALGWLAMTPPISWLARPTYWFVARYRHKLPGGTPACKLPRDCAPTSL